ncbi:MAG TPA: transglutaminase-like cysteine peptidase [Xanthobacteraceae bacterium]|nr:transglutaminase-like cysteine peptidase [Xanthobacteraceae bacterium]
MVRFASTCVGLAFCALVGGCQSAELATNAIAPSPPADTVAAIPASTFMPAGDDVAPPSGFLAFCKRDPGQCATSGAGAAVAHIDPRTWQTLNRVNAAWNGAITPMEDAAHYGVVDYWTIPVDGYGDCEDYALAKRKSLSDFGLPQAALRMAVVRTRGGTAHAVLTVATDRGDYVLDNLNAKVLPWTATGYVWIARQAPGQVRWSAIGSATAGRNLTTADIIETQDR